ncbi:MAG: hypothetical protein WA156_19110, partial [Methylocystis silviterrae]
GTRVWPERSGAEKPIEHGSMRWRGVRSAEPDAAQTPSERNDRRCDERQSVEDVDIGKDCVCICRPIQMILGAAPPTPFRRA